MLFWHQFMACAMSSEGFVVSPEGIGDGAG